MIARPLRVLVAVLIALGTIGISAAHPTDAAGTNVANCSFATLQKDLQAGGDWYYTAGQCTTPITFTSTIFITKTASLTAQGSDVILDGGHTSTVTGVELFHVGTSFALTGLTLTHGYNNLGAGGAIRNAGTLTVTNGTFSDNATSSGYSGGAISTTGPLTITHSTFSGNTSGTGGAIDAGVYGVVVITGSTLSGNTATSGGAIVSGAGSVTITSSSLLGNSASNRGGAIYGGPEAITSSTFSDNSAGQDGGAIYNSDTVTVTGSTFSRNSAPNGGAIFSYVDDKLTIASSSLSGNSATTGNGGAIYGGADTITSSALSLNTASADGGAIFAVGTGAVVITSSTLSHDSASVGGAIDNSNSYTVTITNVTLSGNSASSYGGALYNNQGAARSITDSTFSGNSAPLGAAIYDTGYDPHVTIGGSIVASSSGGNCVNVSSGTLTDTGYNLEWSGAGHTDTCGFSAGKHDITGSDPQLGALQDNGGPTQTMALPATSPAIDKIPTSSGLCPTTDQRGIARPDNGGTSCDIGAYEFVGSVAAPTSTSGPTRTPTNTPTGSSDPILGNWNVTYGSPSVVTMSGSGGSYSVTADTPIEIFGGSSCRLPVGTLLAQFSGSGTTYSGRHGLWSVSNCSFASWEPMTCTLRDNTLTCPLPDAHETVVFSKIVGSSPTPTPTPTPHPKLAFVRVSLDFPTVKVGGVERVHVTANVKSGVSIHAVVRFPTGSTATYQRAKLTNGKWNHTIRVPANALGTASRGTATITLTLAKGSQRIPRTVSFTVVKATRYRDLASRPVLSAALGLPHTAMAQPAIPQPIYFWGKVTEVIRTAGQHPQPEVIRPSVIILAPDGHWDIEQLHWVGWGSSVAHAKGISSESNGIPNMVQGKRIKKPAQITLSSPGRFPGMHVAIGVSR